MVEDALLNHAVGDLEEDHRVDVVAKKNRAWGWVRGKPSMMKPKFQSCSCNRRCTTEPTRSSGTSSPAATMRSLPTPERHTVGLPGGCRTAADRGALDMRRSHGQVEVHDQAHVVPQAAEAGLGVRRR
jgi:hypothetical protein